MQLRRLVGVIGVTGLLAGAGLVGSGASGAATGATSQAKVFFWPQGVHAPAGAAAPASTPSPGQSQNLIFHGGAVEHHPKVYITFWGTEWQRGFKVGPSKQYTQATAMNYETQFFAHLGGSAWNGVQTQFCDNITPGSLSCAGNAYARYITNPANILGGVWVDPSPAPATIATTGLAENLTQDPIAAEAVKARQHFGGAYNPDATYFVFTPPGHAATAYGTVYCAYHSEVTNVGGHGIRYAFMPFTPEQGAGCGGNSVNKKNDAFGNGYFDSYSLAGGHEYSEAVTDPDAFPTQDGWNDYSTSENGDKCAYFHAANIRLGNHLFAVQPMWSNEANGGTGGCAMARGKGAWPVPSPVPGV